MKAYKPPVIYSINIADASVHEYASRCGMHDKKYNRNKIFVDTIFFDREEFDEPPIKAFQGDFFEKLSEFHPIENIKRIDFSFVQFEGNLSENFFQPLKDSIRAINFHNCSLNELPGTIFRNLELDTLFFTSNTFTNFKNPFLGNRLNDARISFERGSIYNSL